MVDYKDTLNLPKTGFEMRAGLARKEPGILAAWDEQRLYHRIQEARRGAPAYVLHDGPPYANGHLHHGHILNKILKDIVVKDRTMMGHRVAYVPGWDCHGLPIEVQVDKKLGSKKASMTKAELRQRCREYAEEYVGIQREQFKRLGVLGRWEDPYLTLSYGYEAQILRELAKFADNGLLYKGLRPINWCTVHQTALAEAEVEYEDHASPSVYVAFELKSLPPALSALGDGASIVIWTTTPWTLPANLAVCVHADYEYVAYPVKGRPCVVAKELLPVFLAAVGEPEVDTAKVLATFRGSDLEGASYQHPLFDRVSPVLLGEHVTLEAGTGCVHTAPGHGGDDFEIGKRHGLQILSPVDGRGVFTAEAGRFAGQRVGDASAAIVEALVDCGALLNSPGDQVVHRYPHCWRCHKPIILRATEQWFVAVDRPFDAGGSLRERAIQAIEEVDWIPPWGKDRIGAMLAARPDWCLSRQRSWGVPIAVVYCEGCNEPVMSGERMRAAAEVFEREGADAWFSRSVSELMGDVVCDGCGGTSFRKEEDILDVWFDSGVSYAAVIEREGLGHTDGPPVSLYLEGSDQHRGWFQSSLLCGLATRGRAPYRSVLTHGFVVDGDGKKLSKSRGNSLDPKKAIDRDGAELLRLWVAAEDYRDDIRISEEILKRLRDTYRKIRNTIRYLLGNISDFDPNEEMLPAGELREVDRYILALVRRRLERVRAAYDRFEFHVVVQTLNELCTVDLSAFYLDVLKDRLYAESARSSARRSAQTAIYALTRDILRAMAPVISFTAEEAWGHLPRLAGDPDSVHLAFFPGVNEPAVVAALKDEVMGAGDGLLAKYDELRDVRRLVNGALEGARRDKVIGSGVEASVALQAPAQVCDRLRAVGGAELADFFIVSEVTVEEGGEALQVRVSRAGGRKCARCWLYRHDLGASAEHPELCARCTEAVCND